MRVGFVTTYLPTQCGIATYSKNLIDAIVDHDDVEAVHVAGDLGAGPDPDGRIEVTPCWPMAGAFDEPVLAALTAAKVDVAHVQHAPDLFGMNDRMPRLVDGLVAAGIPTVVTMHTVYDRLSFIERAAARRAPAYHRDIARRGAIIVHHDSIRPALAEHGVAPERVAAIPHGTTVRPPSDPDEARQALDLPRDAPLFLHFGFIHAQKNLHTALAGFLVAARRAPDARLVVCGKPRAGHWYNVLYLRALQALAKAARLDDRIVWRTGFAPQEDVPRYFAAADVVLLPHALQPYGSASGVFHHALGTGRAIIASRQPKFREVMEVAGLPPECAVDAHSVRAWARAIERFARDADLRRRAAASLARHAEETSWQAVADRHVAVYRGLLAGADISGV